MQLLGSLYLLMQKARKSGLMSIEADIDKPEQSSVFAAIGSFDDANAVVYTFVCDVFRLIVGGNLEPHAMQRYMAAYQKTTRVNQEQEGYASSICIEHGRQGIPAKRKPSFLQMENFIRELGQTPQPKRENIDTALADFYQSIGA